MEVWGRERSELKRMLRFVLSSLWGRQQGTCIELNPEKVNYIYKFFKIIICIYQSINEAFVYFTAFPPLKINCEKNKYLKDGEKI